jgi:hypothetical protein
MISRAVIAWSVIESLCRCGLRTRDAKRGKPKQECDRFFQGTLLMNGNIFVRRPCRTIAANGAELGHYHDHHPHFTVARKRSTSTTAVANEQTNLIMILPPPGVPPFGRLSLVHG